MVDWKGAFGAFGISAGLSADERIAGSVSSKIKGWPWGAVVEITAEDIDSSEKISGNAGAEAAEASPGVFAFCSPIDNFDPAGWICQDWRMKKLFTGKIVEEGTPNHGRTAIRLGNSMLIVRVNPDQPG